MINIFNLLKFAYGEYLPLKVQLLSDGTLLVDALGEKLGGNIGWKGMKGRTSRQKEDWNKAIEMIRRQGFKYKREGDLYGQTRIYFYNPTQELVDIIIDGLKFSFDFMPLENIKEKLPSKKLTPYQTNARKPQIMY